MKLTDLIFEKSAGAVRLSAMGHILANKAQVDPELLLHNKTLSEYQSELGKGRGQAQFDFIAKK